MSAVKEGTRQLKKRNREATDNAILNECRWARIVKVLNRESLVNYGNTLQLLMSELVSR